MGLTWKSVAQNVTNVGSQAVTDVATTAKSLFSTISGQVSAAGSALVNAGSTVVGINANEIPNMQSAIKEYVEALNQHLDEINSEVTTDDAFKGEYAAAIQDYVKQVTVSCKAITSQLLAFSDELNKVAEAYKVQDTDLSKSINDNSGELQSTFKEYVPGTGAGIVQ